MLGLLNVFDYWMVLILWKELQIFTVNQSYTVNLGRIVIKKRCIFFIELDVYFLLFYVFCKSARLYNVTDIKISHGASCHNTKLNFDFN